MLDARDPATLAAPIYVAAMLVEWRVTLRQRAKAEARSDAAGKVLGYERRDTIASIAMGAVSIVTVGFVNLGIAAVAARLWPYRLADLGAGPLAWAVGMLAWDFAYYWAHRWEHEVRFFWAAHVNHHSSQRYNLSTALRQPWLPFIYFFIFPPLALLGIAPWLILTCGGLNLIYQFWIHTETVSRLPALIEFVFNTPSHHRVHHGSNPRYLDRNHGGVLIVWDRLFGTFEPEGERVVYGLTKNIDTYRLDRIFSHEFVAIAQDVEHARSWRERLGFVFRGPGWVPASPASSGLRGAAAERPGTEAPGAP